VQELRVLDGDLRRRIAAFAAETESKRRNCGGLESPVRRHFDGKLRGFERARNVRPGSEPVQVP
jgi:hypothetical protein